MRVIKVASKFSEYPERKEERYRRMCDICDKDPRTCWIGFLSGTTNRLPYARQTLQGVSSYIIALTPKV